MSEPDLSLHWAAFCLQSAMGEALLALSEFKGRDDLRWLDEFEANIMRSIKNSDTQGMSMEAEAHIMTNALEITRFAFGEARAKINAAK